MQQRWVNPDHAAAVTVLRRLQAVKPRRRPWSRCENSNCRGLGAVIVVDSNRTPYTVPCASCPQ